MWKKIQEYKNRKDYVGRYRNLVSGTLATNLSGENENRVENWVEKHCGISRKLWKGRVWDHYFLVFSQFRKGKKRWSMGTSSALESDNTAPNTTYSLCHF